MVLVLILVEGSPPWVDALVWVTTIITVISGADYFFGFRPRAGPPGPSRSKLISSSFQGTPSTRSGPTSTSPSHHDAAEERVQPRRRRRRCAQRAPVGARSGSASSRHARERVQHPRGLHVACSAAARPPPGRGPAARVRRSRREERQRGRPGDVRRVAEVAVAAELGRDRFAQVRPAEREHHPPVPDGLVQARSARRRTRRAPPRRPAPPRAPRTGDTWWCSPNSIAGVNGSPAPSQAAEPRPARRTPSASSAPRAAATPTAPARRA